MKRIIILTLSLAFCVGGPVFARDKIDLVFLVNGDHITGEIKQLERGMLRVKTDSMGEVSIEWEDVAKIQSNYWFQFESITGQRMVAQIQATKDQHKITLVNEKGTREFTHGSIIRIAQMEDTFWSRVNGSANFGFSFTKASDVAQLNFSGRLSHRTEIREIAVKGSVITTRDQSSESTQRSDLQFVMTRFRDNRWFSSYLIGFESNDELGLTLRSSLSAGMGRYMVQTNTSEISILGGLVGTTETLSGDVAAQQNLEGVLGAEYSKYIFDNPSVNMSIRLSVFPSITDFGRVRAQLDANIRRELIKDLYLDLSFYDSYDSDPPSGNAESTNDYGIVTSLGWSF